MRNRLSIAFCFAGAALVLTGSGVGPGRSPPAAGVLPRHPALARLELELKVDLARLEAEALAEAGVPEGLSLAEVIAAAEAWLASGELARCGHPDEHDLAGTRCSRAPGSPLSDLFERILARWVAAGLPPEGATLLHGGVPPFLAGTHRLEAGVLAVVTRHHSAEDLARERDRLVASGLSGAAAWDREALAASLDRRSGPVDLAVLATRIDPQGRDLRTDLLEGVVRPLGWWAGVTGPTGQSFARFALERLGRSTTGQAPLLAPDLVSVPEAPAPAPVPPAEPVPPPRPEVVVAPAPSPPRGDVWVDERGFAMSFGGSGSP